MMKQLLNLSLLLILLISCRKKDARDYKVAINDSIFETGQSIATIRNPILQEASGLASSRTNPGFLWTHNDSGDGAHLYLINNSAEVKMQVVLENVNAIDWEEMSIQTVDSIHYLLIGDIGDNEAKRKNIQIHRIKEPTYSDKSSISISSDSIETLTIQYEEGARDAESFFYDPIDQEILLITKREENVLVYQFPYLLISDPMMIQSKGSIPWRNFTSADLLPNGDILAKNYETIFYWKRNGSAAETLLNGSPVRIPYVKEPQGEAITSDFQGGFYTLSEQNDNIEQQLYYYKAKD